MYLFAYLAYLFAVTEFLSDPQRWGNHFNQKQRVNVVGVTICRESQERHEMMMMDGWMTMMNDHELDLSWIFSVALVRRRREEEEDASFLISSLSLPLSVVIHS